MAEPVDRIENEGTGATRRLVLIAPVICLVAILALHFAFLMSRFAPAIATPDANGYWAQGSLLATTGRTWFVPEADTQYIGIHWLVTEDGRYFSRYPPGLAVLAGLVYGTLGVKASVLINPVLATLSLVGVFVLVRRLLGPWWALVAVGVLAVNPVFNQQAIQCFAHMAVTAPLVWGLAFLAWWSDRGKLWQVFVAGLLFGFIITVRYPEALFALGVSVFVLWHARERPRLWLHAALGATGAAAPIVPLLVRNQLAFGAFYRTGYSLTNEQTGFGWDYFRQHFVGYVRGLNSDGVGLFFALGAIGIVMMCAVRRWRRYGVLLALLVVPTTLLYMAYYWGGMGMGGGMGGGMTMRFLLPTFVCYAVAGTWLLASLTRESSTALRIAAVAVVLLLQFVWGALYTNDEGRQLRHQKEVLARVTDALDDNVERGDVVIANEQILQHLDFVRHWRLVDPMALRPIGGAMRFMPGMGQDADSDEPMPMQREKLAARLEKYKGMTPVEQAQGLAADVDTWAGEHKVYFVGPEEQLSGLRGPFAEGTFKIVARVKLPGAPALDRPFGGPGNPGGMPGGPGGMPSGPGGMPGGPDGVPGRAGGVMPPDLEPGEVAGGPPEGRAPADRPAFRDRAPVNRRGNRALRRGVGGMGGRGGQYGEEIVIAEWVGRSRSTGPADHKPNDGLEPLDGAPGSAH
ncbi:MAG: glycosyltransferase family 39 protein [Verrucomicrobia bacterium]|nr:glycosyltransferase family 39 protein [Verrucomicrobiota bacterium]